MDTAPSPLLLGCIADDFTGATDLANNLVRGGLRTLQTIGVPPDDAPLTDGVQAVVVALKSRTIAPTEAVAQSLAALRWLRRRGARQIYFKYCSTFDSWFSGPVRGNIGPVAEALMDALGSDFSIATPAFPDNGRTVFKGHLFVGEELLSDSGMRHHPLTPMSDANLVRVLQAQCQGRVGLIDHRVVAAGADAIRARIVALRGQGVRLAIVDALSNEDLLRLGPALAGMPLVTGGSGVAIGLPANFGISPSAAASELPPMHEGRAAVVSGSCSQATQRQVQAWRERGLAAVALDPLRLADDAAALSALLREAALAVAQGPLLVYATAPAQAVQQVQQRLGVEAAGQLVEHALAEVARELVGRQGVRRLVVAGGETSGACVQALCIASLRIGPQIAPGVPWCHAETPLAPGQGLHIALKSGNFGADDFFLRTAAD